MQLTLIVHGLRSVEQASTRNVDALRLLAVLGGMTELDRDIDAQSLVAAGLPAGTPVAPLAALGAGFDARGAHVLRADPLALVAGRDDVLMTGRIDDLTGEDAEALRAVLGAHFVDDGLAFHVPRPDAWFVTSAGHVPVATTPLRAVTGSLQPFLPQGPHGRTWRRWLSEMQMLLHAHPVNAAREAAGRAPVTGLWIADGGVLPGAVPALPALHATARPEGDVVRGLAVLGRTRAEPLPASFAALPATDALVVTDPVTDADGLTRVLRDWVEPAVLALERGALSRLVVVGDGHGRAWEWQAAAPSLLGRLKARWRRVGTGR